MYKLIIALLGFASCACVSPSRTPFTGTLPRDVALDMAGRLELSATGVLHLALADSCAQGAASALAAAIECTASTLSRIEVVATAPWRQDTHGKWIDASHLVFEINWKETGLDPLAENTAAVLSQPWRIAGTEWRPSAADVRSMLELLGTATGTEVEISSDGPAPSLEVTKFDVEGGKLFGGASNTLVIEITNRGPGIAYRVTTTTRSNIDALHDQRLSFGLIKPGARKVRRVKLSVPGAERTPDTMLVLILGEGNGFAPGNVSRRIPIEPYMPVPKLGMNCVIPGYSGDRPDIDSGEKLVVSCKVSNTGDAVADSVGLEISIAASLQGRSSVQAIPPGTQATFHVAMVLPRELPVNSQVELVVVARGAQLPVAAQMKLGAMVRKPKLCIAGKLTREQYEAKMDKLRTAFVAGDVTQSQFDRYDAEFVACLSVTSKGGQAASRPSTSGNAATRPVTTRLGAAAPSSPSGVPAENCDDIDVSKVMRNAKSQFDAKNARLALEIVSKALECKQSQLLHRAATFYACRSGNAEAARQHISQVRTEDRSPLSQVCRSEGIVLLDL